MSKVKDSFPGLETKQALDEHRDTVLGFIRKESAICARIEDKSVLQAFGVYRGKAAEELLGMIMTHALRNKD
ncbi:MAG: hypothetical protein ACI4FX_12235 [Agathobacter sp.]